MGNFSVSHWLIVLAIVLLLFGGRGKISQLMGDFGKGLGAFMKGVGANPDEAPEGQLDQQPSDTAKPIMIAQVKSAPPGRQVHQDSAAKV
jgi:sec-independent protein translocase protein TatA